MIASMLHVVLVIVLGYVIMLLAAMLVPLE
jgi:hypothetical protein